MSRKTRSSKHQTVLQGNRRGGGESVKTIVAGMVLALVVTLGVVLSQRLPQSSHPAVQAENGAVRLPVAQVSDGKAHFFTWEGIDFFVLKSSDGVLRAAFDNCDTCFKERKGYRQEGDLMVCNNCDQKFPSALINVMRGGCNPAPLERKVEGDTLVFRTGDLESGRGYFQ